MPSIDAWTIYCDLKITYLSFLTVESEIELDLGNITGSFTAALATNQNGRLVPIISKFDYSILQKTLQLSNGYWISKLITYALSFTEEIITVLISEFGLPLYNIMLPSIVQQQINQQIVTIPVSLPQFNY